MVELVGPDRLGVDHCHVGFRQKILVRHPGQDWQLQHGRSLSRAKVRQQHDLAVRKFDGVVMSGCALHVHLPEAREPTAVRPSLKQTKERATPLDVIFKRKFGARQKTDRYRGLIDGCKAAGTGAWKTCRYELVAGFG
ncbi:MULTISPECIES: hypothetical protein [unclassified Bradyrhizobium]|uniref:hypothetical protein n=1 Tax=unclassified Bradyrhizobium TaxID=2631580 RepID=UPI0024797171|nr:MULTISPECIES: hypothetical protein [unclassified Bradyrhizobium]WGS19770.1 hypothetical protein MTX22_36455 [Bradyrhizobium sp. ISRA463]WGS26615.1 hypothetical protein MTX19_33910 [Bradyrhizobium sp. ISRA464]